MSAMLIKLGLVAMAVAPIARLLGIWPDGRVLPLIGGFLLVVAGIIWKLLAPAKPSNQRRSAPLSESEALRHKALANLISLNARGTISDTEYQRARTRLEATKVTTGFLALLTAVAALGSTSDSTLNAGVGDTLLDDFMDSGTHVDDSLDSDLFESLFSGDDDIYQSSILDDPLPGILTDDSLFETDIFGSNTNDDGHAVNIDGTPMCGDIDMNGNPYGITDD